MRDTVLAQRIFTGLGEASRASEGRVAYSQIPEDCQKTSAYSQKTDAFSKGTSKASKGITESQLGAPPSSTHVICGKATSRHTRPEFRYTSEARLEAGWVLYIGE